MRIHFTLNHGSSPESKLADVEIHFEEGPLAGLKLVGCSVWRSRKEEEKVAVLVPSRSYATAGGVRYYDLLRDSEDGPGSKNPCAKGFKRYIREEYLKIAAETTAS
jgi:hypothetical protein